ncbi:Fic family protein [Patescibacteria group bacterium]|nr:Fic family protein [Patescibacteria group bacterium]
MATTNMIKNKIKELKAEYNRLSLGKKSLLDIIDEIELSENVFNSNAIENSTLSLKETEKILLNLEVSRNVSTREVFEAKNLATVIEYIKIKFKQTEFSREFILLLHKMLIMNINENIAGRFRQKGEYVRIGSHIALPPEQIEETMRGALLKYRNNHESYFIDNIAQFHLDFENIHPFCDGNGRIGRVLINYQLLRLGFPMIIIRDKEKQKYYDSFAAYRTKKNLKPMGKIITLALFESLHKRISYLRGENIISLAEFAKKKNKSINTLINAARRQTIQAFREKGVWKIGSKVELN